MTEQQAEQKRQSAVNRSISRCALDLKVYDRSPRLNSPQKKELAYLLNASAAHFDIREPDAKIIADRYLAFLSNVYTDKRAMVGGFAVPVGQSTYHVEIKPFELNAMLDMISAGVTAANVLWPENASGGSMGDRDKDEIISRFLILDDDMLHTALREMKEKQARRIAGILKQRGHGAKYPRTIDKYHVESETAANNMVNINHVDYLTMMSFVKQQVEPETIKRAAMCIVFKITESTRKVAKPFEGDLKVILDLLCHVKPEDVPDRTDPRFVPATTMTKKKCERIIFMAASSLMPDLKVVSLEMLPLAKDLPESVKALRAVTAILTDDPSHVFKMSTVARALINPFDCVFNFGIKGLLNTIPGKPAGGSVGFVVKFKNSETSYINADLALTKENRDASIEGVPRVPEPEGNPEMASASGTDSDHSNH